MAKLVTHVEPCSIDIGPGLHGLLSIQRSQTKIAQFKGSIFHNQEVLPLNVHVTHALMMKLLHDFEELADSGLSPHPSQILYPYQEFHESQSSFVHLSAFRPAPWALIVSCEVGEQNTSTKSMCFSLLFPWEVAPWSHPCISQYPSGKYCKVHQDNLFSLLCLCSIERFCGICFPLHSRVKGSRRLILYLFPVILFSIITAS